MNLKQWTTKSLALLGMLQTTVVPQAFAQQQQTAAQVARPIQYVMLAFDGSYNNDVWQYSRNFAAQKNAANVALHFTYFINPVYMLWKCIPTDTTCQAPPYQRSDWYQPPGYHPEVQHGQTVQVKNIGSAIGWGDGPRDISTRLEHMNQAFNEGHEIGSHAVGHFDGTSWSYQDWREEFRQFYRILDNVFTVNQIQPSATFPQGLAFRNSIVGFRAPVLGYSNGLYQALPEFGIKYDTSKQSLVNYWPQQINGMWNFPLADIPRPGTARVIPTMDYNFCYVDSARLLQTDPDLVNYTEPGAKRNTNRECLNTVRPAQKAELKANMLSMYMNYFNNSYYGNRAPIHIGHHFSKWMSGAYFETFFEFANQVCGLPEVRCVVYSDLMQFMNSTPAATIAQYRAGNFPHLPRPKAAAPARVLDIQAQVLSQNGQYQLQVSGRSANMTGISKAIYVGTQRFNTDRVTEAQVRQVIPAGQDSTIRAVVYDRQGVEVQSSTHRIYSVGTNREIFTAQSVEQKALQGHMMEAHIDENNTDTFGH